MLLGEIKKTPEDFQVIEKLGFELSGEGEHVWLFIQKRDLNTQDITKRLARLANVPRKDVGYSGLKDKNAVTQQWFSVRFPTGEEPDWLTLNDEQLKILKIQKHHKKLKVGTHQSNHFKVKVRGCQIDDPVALERTLKDIEKNGFLNLFAEQRFGREGANIQKAEAWLKGELKVKSPKDQGFLLSVLRAQLSNAYLLARQKINLINKAICGDIVGFPGANSWFNVTADNLDEVNQRLSQNELVLAGILPGVDKKLSLIAEGREFAERIWSQFECYTDLLQRKVEMGFRAAIVWPTSFVFSYDENEGAVELEFELPTGSYATALLDALSGRIAK